ncbi:MAG: hypothetical protein SNJ57_09260 [Cyanobacteriota bacterium]
MTNYRNRAKFMIDNLPPLTGSRKQVEWANTLRNKALWHVWNQGWHGDYAEFQKDCNRLPVDSTWWIENRIGNASHEAVRKFLGLEYMTKAGSDY